MKPANETPVVKSPYTKTVEQFKKLSLTDMDEAIEIMTEIYDSELEKDSEKLASQLADNKEKQAKLKK